MDATVISFDDWEQVLKTAVPPDRQRAYHEAIIKFRYWLRETGKTAWPKSSKSIWTGNKPILRQERFAIRQEALRWYYCEGRNRMTVQNVPLSCHDTASDANQDHDNNSARGTKPAGGQATSRWLYPLRPRSRP